jgi:hypothetical protein
LSSPSATPSQPGPLPTHSYSTRVHGLVLTLSCFRALDCLSHEHRSISVQLVLSNHFSIQLNNEVTQRTSLSRIVPHPLQPCRARVLGSCLTICSRMLCVASCAWMDRTRRLLPTVPQPSTFLVCRPLPSSSCPSRLCCARPFRLVRPPSRA